ncbi:S-adenosyl-L-methionine-dependent methyltransferase [Neurospora tetraspora]|uniref:S-adenosyl-L-methionine-dependent methyltransferase n=1 Tax=Neurospora tetraspora TaxID=94610 RepID=A0AAE0MNZ4_9PEZI|nr:S-adenosyl-L-methionine-dependent methyltransferase [Neurospora tetraspora]
MYAKPSAIRSSVPKGNNSAASAIKSLKAIHQITGQYLVDKKNVQAADQRNTSGDVSDRDMEEAFSVLTEVKQLLASSAGYRMMAAAVVVPPKPIVEKSSDGAARPPPQEVIMGLFAQMSVVSAINLFKHWGIFDAIPIPIPITVTNNNGSGSEESELNGGISFADLAEKVNVEQSLLIRISKMLTSTAILGRSQDGLCLYHTPTSLFLVSTHPMSAMFSLLHTNIVSVSASLPSYFDTYGRREPVGVNHVPLTVHEKKPELKYFDLVCQDPKRMAEFMKAMSITHSSRVPTVGIYDMTLVLSEARAGGRETVWVDVGGGGGHSVKLFLREYGGHDGLKAHQCVVHDLDDVVQEGARRAGVQEEDDEMKGVRFLPLDFHCQSPVKGALIYYLRHIMRDYSDPVCSNILRNVARSLSPEARILISEQITPEEGPPTTSQPSSQQMYAAFKDFSMLSIGGKERSLDQWRSVAAEAGLEISRVYMDPKGTAHGVVELKLADTWSEEVSA